MPSASLHRCVLTRAALVATLLTLSLARSGAAVTVETQLLFGRKLVIRQGPKGDRLMLLAAAHDLIAPLPGGTDDPSLAAAAVMLVNPVSGEWHSASVPTVGWELNGLGTVFRFHDTRPRGQGVAVRSLVIRHGKRLKLRGTAVGLTLDERAQHALAVVVTTGSRRYCTLFGGNAVRRDEPGRFVARNAPAPPVCAEPPSPTPSPTSTTSLPAGGPPTTSTTTTTETSSTSATTATAVSTSTTSSSTSSTDTTGTTSTTSTSSTEPSPTSTSTTVPSSSTSTSSSSTSSTSSSAPSTAPVPTTTSTTLEFCSGTGACNPNAPCPPDPPGLTCKSVLGICGCFP